MSRVSEGAAASMTRLSYARPRTRRSSAHKYIGSRDRGHIPSLRAWMRQIDVAQRRHASNGTVVELSRHPSPPPPPSERHVWQKKFQDVADGPDTFDAEDAWHAYRCLCDSDEDPPGPPLTTISFLANLARSVTSGQQGERSPDLLRTWGTRIQDALHHIDPGIEDTARNHLRIRRNSVWVSASAMTGKLEEAIEDARVLFHLCDLDRQVKFAQRAHTLRVYTDIIRAMEQYRSPAAVLDYLVEHSSSLSKYLLDSQPWQAPSILRSIQPFRQTALAVLSSIVAPDQCLDSLSSRWSKTQLSFAGTLLIRAMHQVGRAKDALAVVQFLHKTSVPVSSPVVGDVIRALAQKGMFEEASAMFSALPHPSPDHRSQQRAYHSAGLLLYSSQGDVQRAEEHFNNLAQRKLVDHVDQNSIMHAYARAGQPERVVELFNGFFSPSSSTEPHPGRPNIVHYTTVIFAHSQVGDLDGVNTWFMKLSEAGFRPDLYVYNIILDMFASRGDSTSMISVLDQMRNSGIAMNAIIYTNIISALAKRNDPISAERVYKRALEEGIVPDRQMVTAIMNAHVESGSWQGVVRAWDYLNTTGRAGAGITIEVFNTLMKAYVLIGAPFRTVANLFRSMSSKELRPDSRTFALLIQSACDSGFMDIAEDLYQEMEHLATEQQQTSVEVNVYVLTILMSGYLRQGKRLKAKSILDRMKGRNIEPTAVSYAAILKAYGEQKTDQGIKVAEQFLNSLMSNGGKDSWMQMFGGRKLTVETVYRPLLNAYAQREQPAQVARLYEGMLRAGAEPSLGTLTMLLDAHRRVGNVAGVEAVWPQVQRLGLEFTRQNALLIADSDQTPNLGAYGSLMCVPFSILIDALSAAGKHAEVAQTWKTLKEQGLQFDSHNWNHLVTALVRAGEPQRAFDIVENVILRYQHQTRRELERERDPHPTSPLTLDLPPPEEGDLPPHRPEAPLHTAARRTSTAQYMTRRLRNRLQSMEEHGAHDFVHPLYILHTMSPLWNTWRPHGGTLVLLGRVLDHYRSGRLVQAIRPEVDSEFEQRAVDAEEIRKRTEVAGLILGEIYERFPRTVHLVREYELMRRASAYRNAAAQDRS